jgi:amidase
LPKLPVKHLPNQSQHYYEKFARTGEPVIKSLESCGLLSVPGTTLKGYFDLNIRRAEIAQTYLHLFNDNKLDVILMPPAPHTAVPHDRWAQPAYTCLWNYLDYPALVIPVDKVRDTDSVDDPSNASFSPRDEEIYKLCEHIFFSSSISRPLIDMSLLDTGPEEYKDAPVCVQLVGYKHRDESLLKAAALLDSIINQA